MKREFSISELKPHNVADPSYVGEVSVPVYCKRYGGDWELSVSVVLMANDPDIADVEVWDISIGTTAPEDEDEPDGDRDGYHILLKPSEFLEFTEKCNEMVAKLRSVGKLP